MGYVFSDREELDFAYILIFLLILYIDFRIIFRVHSPRFPLESRVYFHTSYFSA